jgi:hypothetical protein
MFHAQFLHDPPGCGIAFEMVGVNPVEIQGSESIFQDGLRRLGTIAVPPVRPADPVSEFRPPEFAFYDQAHGPDQLI